MIKIIATSDWHGALPTIPECDILMIGGDNTVRGAQHEYERFFQHVQQAPCKHAVAVGGNHDNPDFYNERWESDKIIRLYNQPCEVMGLQIWGSPCSQPFNDWNFMPDDDSRDDIYSEIPNDLDILLTHGPEWLINDMNGIGEHIGDKILADHIARAKPYMHIAGHVHEGYGYSNISGTHSYNVSYVGKNFSSLNPPVEIRLNNKNRLIGRK